MTRRVEVALTVFESAHAKFGPARSGRGDGSEYDFVGGPLAAAVFAFREFDSLSYDLVPAVRSYTVVDPIFWVISFAAVLRTDNIVEIVSFADDPDYWASLDNDPE
ncbi:MAG: hypothetical protein AB7U39_25530 [Ilumatobacteraceae bacterium]